MKEQLILASRSPRRREYLALLGLPYTCVDAHVEEKTRFVQPHKRVMDIARQKAMAITTPGSLVLGADTVVVVDKTVLGKPGDAADARRMLEMLSGRKHAVYTGVCLHRPDTGEVRMDYRKTSVWVAPLTQAEMEGYIQTGEPFDKAGAYAIQGRFAPYIQGIQGCYFNVVGLPIQLVYEMLRDMHAL